MGDPLDRSWVGFPMPPGDLHATVTSIRYLKEIHLLWAEPALPYIDGILG
jgi:hypothetical protein